MKQCDLELLHSCLSAGSLKGHYTEAEQALILRALTLYKTNSNENITTILRVVQLLVDQEIDARVVISTLLAVLLRKQAITLKTIREQFGKEVAHLAGQSGYSSADIMAANMNRHDDSGSTHCPPVNLTHQATLMLALLLIDLEQMAEGQQECNLLKAREALHVFVPMASRLNLRNIRRRLEDAAFRVLEPDIYENLKHQVAPQSVEDAKILEILRNGIQTFLKRERITGEVHGRIKSLYSLHKKIERTGRSVQSIMDRIGLRVVVSSVPECYKVLGILHSHFESIPCCFDDYISVPKENGYQSLHTCIFPVRDISYKPVELQIRTELMHHEAEYGVAAHSRYKDQIETAATDTQSTSHLLDDLVAKNAQQPDSDEFIRCLCQQIYTDNLVIFGQAGQIINCTENMTVGQYLYNAGIDISAKSLVHVNGKKVNLSDILHDTDSVEIITPDTSPQTWKMTSSQALSRKRSSQSKISTD